MLRHNNPKIDTQRLCERVRELAALAEAPPVWDGEDQWRNSLQGRAVELGASSQLRCHGVSEYSQLLCLPDTDFIDAAYRSVMGRIPTHQERGESLERMMQGEPRERLLMSLVSQVGRPKAPVIGMSKGLFKARVKYFPKVGRVFRWILAAFRLDRFQQRYDQHSTLQEARYQALLESLRQHAVYIESLERSQRHLAADLALLRQQKAHVQGREDVSSSSHEPVFSNRELSQGQGRREVPQRDADGRDFYRALEARFRGAPANIAALMREHLPEVLSVTPINKGLPLLDLGCGRGEWLTILREKGIAARGVDLNAANVEACREQGLEVRCQDALTALEEAADASLGMISAFHLVEHLDHDQLRYLLHQAYRTLAPNGRLLLETPNPTNLIVASCNFYLDPTHIRPLPPDLLIFLAEFAGFEAVKVRALHPVAEELRVHEESEVAQRLNHFLYGPQDYVLLATRPSNKRALSTDQEQVE